MPAAATETCCLRLAADCCDGSDERAGLCRNTCVEAGAAARAQLKQRAAAAAEGGKIRTAYAQTWSVQEAAWRAELKRLEADIAQKQKHVSYWQGARPPQAPASGRVWCRVRAVHQLSAGRLDGPVGAGKKQAVEAEEALEREREQAARAAQEAAAAALAAASNLTGGAAAPAPSAGEAPQHERAGEPAGSEGQVPEGAMHADGPHGEAGADGSPSLEEPEGQGDTAPPEASVEEVDATPADAEAANGQQQPVEHAPPEAAGDEHPPGEHAEEPDEESAEERGKRVAAQWTHDPEAIGEVAEVRCQAPAAVRGVQVARRASAHGRRRRRSKRRRPPQRTRRLSQAPWMPRKIQCRPPSWVRSTPVCMLPRARCRCGLPHRRAPACQHRAPACAGVWGAAKGWLARGLGFAKGAALPSQQRQHVKDTFAKHQSVLTELTGKKAELERKLGLDFGPAGAFAALLDRWGPGSSAGPSPARLRRPPRALELQPRRCFTADVEKYVYEVCIYQEARQKEGAASTSLGSWRGFEDDHTAAVFDGGQHCWNGPQRSMRVRSLPQARPEPVPVQGPAVSSARGPQVALQCGVEEVLANVSEPNRCEYVARLFTPAACTPDHVSHAWRELEAAEQELASVHDEL